MLLVRVCLGSSVGSTGRDGEAEPVVPTLGGRMWQKIGVGNATKKYFRCAQSVANKLLKVSSVKVLMTGTSDMSAFIMSTWAHMKPLVSCMITERQAQEPALRYRTRHRCQGWT